MTRFSKLRETSKLRSEGIVTKLVSSSEWSTKICDRRKQQSVRFRNNGAPENTQGQLMNYLVTTTLRGKPASLALASAIFHLALSYYTEILE
jgi:hypothetical protein